MGDLDHPSTLGFPNRVERPGELGVGVPDQESGLDAFVVASHGRISSLLGDPGTIRIVGWRTDMDPAATEVDEDQDVGGPLTQRGDNVLAEKICRYNAFHVRCDEGHPVQRRLLFLFLRGWMNAGFGEDALDRGCTGVKAEFLEFTGNTAIPPQNVFFGHADGGVTQLLGQAWAAKELEGLALVGLIDPTPIGGGLDDLHQVADVVVAGSAETEKFRFFTRRRCDPLGRYPCLEDSDLCFEKPDLGVMPRAENLGHQDP